MVMLGERRAFPGSFVFERRQDGEPSPVIAYHYKYAMLTGVESNCPRWQARSTHPVACDAGRRRGWIHMPILAHHCPEC